MAKTKRKQKQEPSSPEQDLMLTIASGVDVANRTIYIVGEVTDETVTKMLVTLDMFNQSIEPVRLVVSSCGGGEPQGYAIYDALMTNRNQVLIDCYGTCQSIAALILQAGDIRRLSPNCRFMIHNGSVELNSGINTDTLVAIGKEMGVTNARYHEILAERSGVELAAVQAMCQEETYLSATEAVDMGFADAVIGVVGK